MNINDDEDPQFMDPLQEPEDPNAPAQGPAPPVQFSLTPGTFDGGIINMNSNAGTKIYKNAIAKLPVEIDCTPKNLKLFLSALEDRAMEYGWEHILEIPNDVNNILGPTKNMLTEYGQIELAHLREHVETYAHQPNRAAQDSMMLFQCLKNSLTDAARAKILLHRIDYTTDTNIASGPLLLKVIVRESYNDTNATVKFIRSRLSNLAAYMKSIDSDIGKFNQYVQDQLDSLNARGQVTNDLLSNLFLGYAAASDRNFVAYIGKKEDEYDEGANIEPVRLMQLAQDKYQTLVEGGLWNAPTEEESKIMALEAEVKKIKSSKGGNKDKKDSSKKDKSNKKTFEKPKWMAKEPEQGKPKEKKVDGKQYHWCPNHKQWTRHKPSECRLKEDKKAASKETKQEEKQKASDSTKAKIVQALTTVIDDDDSE